MRLAAPLLLCPAAVLTLAWIAPENPDPAPPNGTPGPAKHCGVSWVAGPEIRPEALDALARVHTNAIVQTPFGWQSTHDSPEIELRTERVFWGERDEGLTNTARWARARGVRTLLKPHIWLTRAGGKWRSDIEMSSESEWASWFSSYRAFLLHYAELAERVGIEGLVVGTELHKTVLAKPDEWRALIRAVREVYSGELTYAANWYREYLDVPFWDELDYIGIQAYFPISTSDEATSIADLEAGWAPHHAAISQLQKRYRKPVLFTEIGYKSTPGSTREPWLWLNGEEFATAPADQGLQERAYRAFFETFWDEPWFAGSYFWKWHPAVEVSPETRIGPRARSKNPDFSPQGKPAEGVLGEWYGRSAG